MELNNLQIPMDLEKRIRELKNTTEDPTQQDAESELLLHKELIGEKKVMICDLYEAVENGSMDNFVQSLEKVCEERKRHVSCILDQVTGAGESLLHVAANLGKEQIAVLLCHHFPELLNRRNVRGDTALHVAVRSKHSSIVNFILSQYATAGEDIIITRVTNEYGDTPLHEAVYSGDVDFIQKILAADKEVVHCLNKSKRSPLYLAVVNGNLEILDLLLDVPLPTDLPRYLGNSPLHAAIMERKPVLINRILVKRPELVYLRDEDGGIPLHYAAYIGYLEGFQILLKNSLEKSDQTTLEVNKEGYLPIHLACKRGHVKVVREFLKHEWPLKPYVLLNQKGQNILHVAAENGKSNVVQHLLRNRKIDQYTINQQDNDGNTPLHLASINLFPKVLYFVTRDKRTNVNLLNSNGLTARDIVGLALKNQMTIRKFLANLVLKEAGVPLKVNDMLHSQQQVSKRNSSLKDLLNTFLVVATLMVTVTFAAAFTVPGGVYGSDDPNPKNRGMAVLAHKPLFWIFTTFNMIAMYSSVIACGLMLMALIFDKKLATRATILAMCCLVFAFLTVPVAFMAAVRLVVDNNSALARLITVIGVVYTIPILLGLFFGFFPIGIRLILFRHVGRLCLRILIALIDYDDKPEDSSSQKVDTDRQGE